MKLCLGCAIKLPPGKELFCSVKCAWETPANERVGRALTEYWAKRSEEVTKYWRSTKARKRGR